MMKNRTTIITILLIITSLLSFSSCNKDPNPFVKHEQDISIVYGLINPVDSIHYIRIQKAYLTSEDAYILATDEETNIYLDSLTVRVYLTNINGTIPISGMDWTLDKVYVHKTETSDDFYWNVDYPVFRFIQTFNHSYISDKIFHLEITNNYSGKQIYGETYVVNDYVIRQPSSINATVPQFGMSYTANTSKIEFAQALYGKRYNVYMTFEFDEYQRSGSYNQTPVHKILKWNYGTSIYDGNAYEVSLANSTYLTIYYSPNSFYPWLEDNLVSSDEIIRVARCFNFYFWSCTPEMHTYMSVNSQQTGIIQDRPEYTNLTSNTGENDVYGLFATRYSKIYKNLQVQPTTLSYLIEELDLGFQATYP
ncbi:MAG: hypothetical protein PHP65_04820 [Bacilli bacterium]|nr:hypothetical protein [Bacilli bacterium]